MIFLANFEQICHSDLLNYFTVLLGFEGLHHINVSEPRAPRHCGGYGHMKKVDTSFAETKKELHQSSSFSTNQYDGGHVIEDKPGK
ncbi:hypothetical protein VNO78_21879 [Psophocarpus tetragonolobus]|uniref:Uncharacterized protein n=1 Tax=Psophocarpus tetragonolobus TaxID=3891 RepID=A0AAN9SCB9_PSOTE